MKGGSLTKRLARETMMQEEIPAAKKKSSLIMAVVLSLAAIGFYIAGIYLANQ